MAHDVVGGKHEYYLLCSPYQFGKPTQRLRKLKKPFPNQVLQPSNVIPYYTDVIDNLLKNTNTFNIFTKILQKRPIIFKEFVVG